ncbi:MAG: hypothetical protein Q4G59_09770, partial [Planctomycetia bacterium]|nr:hypothetical protein [Planctomycetia bacterium]
MRLKKQILTGLFIVLLLCVGRLMAADDTAQLISDNFMYPTPLSVDESLIDFAGAKNKGIIDLPFAKLPQLNRGSNDYKITLDASTAVKFMVDIENLNPEVPYSKPVFYFKSGDGWYSLAGKVVPLSQANICRYEFEPTRMRSEGKPTGLKNIAGFLVAIYNNDKKADSKVRLIAITAQKPSMLFVIEPKDDSNAEPYSDNLIKILKQARVASMVVKQSDLTTEFLKSAPVVMVPYQEKLSKDSTALLLDYAKNGGFLIISYTMPEQLMQGMGFAKGKYVRAKKIGDDFAKMVFDPKLVEYFDGLLPEALPQSSHNIISTQPLDAEQITDSFLKKEENRPRVAAWWYDGNGNKTKHAAILQSGYGLFLSHVLYASPVQEKANFLRSFCLLRDESLRKELLLDRWRDVLSIGMRLEDDPRAKRAQILPDVLAPLSKKGWSCQQIETLLQGKIPVEGFRDYSRFLADLDQVRADMIAKVCRSFGGKKVEGRLWWEHSGTGAYPGDWDRTCKELAEANFNGIVVNMLWGGSAHYKSDFLPPHRKYLEYGDQVAQACAACKKYGLELHIW